MNQNLGPHMKQKGKLVMLQADFSQAFQNTSDSQVVVKTIVKIIISRTKVLASRYLTRLFILQNHAVEI